jgi:hypothetical protein
LAGLFHISWAENNCQSTPDISQCQTIILKVKINKSYLRSTHKEERFRDLAVLAIEANEAEQMDTKELIKTFSEMKARKKNVE